MRGEEGKGKGKGKGRGGEGRAHAIIVEDYVPQKKNSP